MIQILDAPQKPRSFKDALLGGVADAMQKFPEMMQKKQQQEQMSKQRDKLSELTGIDLSGVNDPAVLAKVLDRYMEGQNRIEAEQLKGQNERESDQSFYNQLFGGGKQPSNQQGFPGIEKPPEMDAPQKKERGFSAEDITDEMIIKAGPKRGAVLRNLRQDALKQDEKSKEENTKRENALALEKLKGENALAREKIKAESSLARENIKNERVAGKEKAKKDEEIANVEGALNSLNRMKAIRKKGNLGRGSESLSYVQPTTRKDRGEYSRLGKSLISYATPIVIRNRVEFELMADDLYDPNISDSEAEGILEAMEKIILDNLAAKKGEKSTSSTASNSVGKSLPPLESFKR